MTDEPKLCRWCGGSGAREMTSGKTTVQAIRTSPCLRCDGSGLAFRPCPTCGAVNYCTGGQMGFSVTSCITCGTAAKTELWNTRPVEDELRAEVERLREALRLGHDALDRLMGDTDLDEVVEGATAAAESKKGARKR
jgi:hypothetical protein